MKNREPHTKKPICAAVHKVAAGDTLYKIARRYGVDYGRLMTLNGITNPYNVKIGTEICIPPNPGTGNSSCSTYYVIREGDTLYSIARNFGVSLESLMAANSDVDPYNMHIGMQLCIPPRRPEPPQPERPPHRPSMPSAPSRPNAPGNQRPGTPTPSRPSIPGNQWTGTPTPSQPNTPGNQQPITPTSSQPSTPGNQRPITPTSSQPSTPENQQPITPTSSRPSTPGNQRPDHSIQIMPHEDECDDIVSSDTVSSAPISTGAAVMNALNPTGKKTKPTDDTRRTGQSKKSPGNIAVFAEMTAETITASDAAAVTPSKESMAIPSETTNLDNMTISEPSSGNPIMRPFVSDTIPDGILYRVEQGETLTDILRKFGICFSALDYSNSSIDLTSDLTDLTLNIPYGDRFCTSPNNQRYVIRRNDDLDSLSLRFNIPTDTLLRLNPTKNPENFSSIGSRINVSDDL